MRTASSIDRERLPSEVVERARRSRRHPRPIQFDYLHLRRLVDNLTTALHGLRGAQDVLDVFCGSRPYDDLLPGSRAVGFDITDGYGVADVVSDDFLPFPDASFDLIVCIEAFHFARDGAQAASEMARVLRPGGAVLISVPVVWEYSRAGLEHRYTASSLASVFGSFDHVKIVENGGWAVTWTSVTGAGVRGIEQFLRGRARAVHTLAQPLFSGCYLLLNALGTALDAVERRMPQGSTTLPANILLTARRPLEV